MHHGRGDLVEQVGVVDEEDGARRVHQPPQPEQRALHRAQRRVAPPAAGHGRDQPG
jgi:hypothetical protein